MNISTNKIIKSLLLFLLSINFTYSQSPVWPLSSTWNQINCTFYEKHSAFHSAIDINLPDGNAFKAVLDGVAENDAATVSFLTMRHDF